jgi:hypothetical protein
MNARSASLVVLSLIPSLAQAGWPTPPYANGGTARTTRACSADTYTLEVPPSAPGFPTGFEAAFTSSFGLKGMVFDCPSCTAFRPMLRAVFPDYSNATVFPSVPPSRRDGHRRAFVVSFQGLKGSAWVTTRPVPTSECLVLKAIRGAAARALFIEEPTSCCATPLRFHVARGCDGVMQDAEAFNAPAVTNWALHRVKVPAPAVLPAVEVALVDTGIPVSLRGPLGVASEQPLPWFEGDASAPHHPHGVHMAALIRAAAPHATLRSYRALDERGMGSLSSVARSVDDVLFANNRAVAGRPPLVMNLSLGAPPEVSHPALLTGASSCTTWEDGAGESLRYALRVAAEVDFLWSTVFIATASGNSVLEKTTVAATPWLLGNPRTACGVTPGGPRAFLPAAFGEAPSCLGAGWAAVLPVIPVGATTYRDARSAITQSASEPFLLAPGERVFAAHPALASVQPEVACGPADVGLWKGFELPAAVSGTSASTALVSAAAAQVLARAPAPSAIGSPNQWPPPRAGWRGAWLARLLYLTGQPVCSRGLPSAHRRLSIERAVDASTSSASACVALKACTADPGHTGAALNASTASRCATSVAGCFASSPLPLCGVNEPEPDWADAFVASVVPTSACARAWDAEPGPPTFRPTGPNARFSDSQLGGLGPQPANPACPNCSVRLHGAGTMVLSFEFNDAFPAETKFTDAFLVLMDAEKQVVEMIPVSTGEPWRPGFVGRLRLAPFERDALSLLREGGSVSLDVAVSMPDLAPEEGRNVSVLRVVLP